MMASLRFEDIAQRAAISPTTLRYYIRLGLLPVAERTPAGHKVYPPAALNRLAAISRAKRLGFTLQEIKQLFGDEGWSECMGASKLETLNAQIEQLTGQRDALAKLNEPCGGQGRCALVSHIKEGETWDNEDKPNG